MRKCVGFFPFLVPNKAIFSQLRRTEMRSNFAVLWKFKTYLDKRWVGGSKMFLFMLRVKNVHVELCRWSKRSKCCPPSCWMPFVRDCFLIIYPHLCWNKPSSDKEKPFLNLEFVYIFQIDSVHIRSVRWWPTGNTGTRTSPWVWIPGSRVRSHHRCRYSVTTDKTNKQ